MRILFVLLTVLLAPAALANGHTPDDVATIRANLASAAAVLVDVREPSEVAEGRLEGALEAPLSELQRGRGWEHLPTDRILYLYCRSGNRVLPAAEALRRVGFADVRALRWGYAELVRRGFPVANQ